METTDGLDVYRPQMFESLPEFHLARNELEVHRPSIDMVGGVIVDHGFDDVLAVNLLHKHFELDEDEILVRSFVDESRAVMRPWKRSVAEGRTTPYLWRYAVHDGEWAWFPLEFLEDTSGTPIDFALVQCGGPLLRRIGESLVAQNLHELFGVAALYSRHRFKVPAGSTLLETTDEVNRVLTLQCVPLGEIERADSTQTLWVFTRKLEEEVSHG